MQKLCLKIEIFHFQTNLSFISIKKKKKKKKKKNHRYATLCVVVVEISTFEKKNIFRPSLG